MSSQPHQFNELACQTCGALLPELESSLAAITEPAPPWGRRDPKGEVSD